VWAIGTGKMATPEIAQYVHSVIRAWLRTEYGEAVSSAVRILYGGSVTADSAEALLRAEDIDGALVGGASLKADSFAQIVRAALRATKSE
jgi:triosephosphate isomerase